MFRHDHIHASRSPLYIRLKPTEMRIQVINFRAKVVVRKWLMVRKHEALACWWPMAYSRESAQSANVTPHTPKKLISGPTREEDIINMTAQSRFRARNLQQPIQAQQKRGRSTRLENEFVLEDKHGTLAQQVGIHVEPAHHGQHFALDDRQHCRPRGSCYAQQARPFTKHHVRVVFGHASRCAVRCDACKGGSGDRAGIVAR